MKRKSLNIAIFHLGFVYSGGGEKLVITQALGLMKAGHKVDVFAPVVDKKVCFPGLIRKVSVSQMIPSFRFLPEWESLQVILACLVAPFIARRYRNYDVIFACNQPSCWIAYWVKRLYGVSYVSYLAQPTRFIYPRKIDKEEGLIFTKKYPMSLVSILLKVSRPFSLYVDKKSIQASNVILSNGDYITRLIKSVYSVSSKDVSAPASIEPDIVSRSKREKGFLKVGNIRIKKPYLLVTNRHFPQKRFEYALFVLQSLIADYESIKLVITGGETAYTAYIKKLAQELSLIDHMIFTGLVSESELSRLYKNAFVYLYTAPEEDYGMGIIEAMGAGTPVVVWDKAGPKYLVENGVDGLTSAEGDLSEYINNVHQLVHTKSLYLKIQKNAYSKVKNSYSVSEHIKSIEKVLTEVI